MTNTTPSEPSGPGPEKADQPLAGEGGKEFDAQSIIETPVFDIGNESNVSTADKTNDSPGFETELDPFAMNDHDPDRAHTVDLDPFASDLEDPFKEDASHSKGDGTGPQLAEDLDPEEGVEQQAFATAHESVLGSAALIASQIVTLAVSGVLLFINGYMLARDGLGVRPLSLAMAVVAILAMAVSSMTLSTAYRGMRGNRLILGNRKIVIEHIEAEKHMVHTMPVRDITSIRVVRGRLFKMTGMSRIEFVDKSRRTLVAARIKDAAAAIESIRNQPAYSAVKFEE